MSNTRRPICFIATTQPEAASAFYQDIIGLKLIESSPFALVFDDAGTMLRIQIVPELSPAGFTVHGWVVENIEHDVRDLAAKGATFLHFDHLEQSASGVWSTPDGHKIAWLKDPCGNTLSLTEFV